MTINHRRSSSALLVALGDANAADAAALSLAVHRIEHLIGHRRTMLNSKSTI
jgi:hypothetical protein